ncbi:hypothetical protein [Parachlamydia acanthamoebae]|nr:hypothetical protein [Parachlamydia acanthamoebae]
MRSFIHIGMIRSWWVILFVLFCLMCYEQGIKQRETDFLKLTEQLLTLQHQKKKRLHSNKSCLTKSIAKVTLLGLN